MSGFCRGGGGGGTGTGTIGFGKPGTIKLYQFQLVCCQRI